MMALTVPRVPGVSERPCAASSGRTPASACCRSPIATTSRTRSARLDDPEAELHVREHAEAPRSRCRGARGDSRGDGGSVARLDGGFEPGRIYECYYRAENPPVVGLGFAAVRDTAAFLRWASAAEGNPCAGQIDRSYVFGVSQSGRFLRHLLYLGLDEDEAGRPGVGRGACRTWRAGAGASSTALRPALAQRAASGRQPVPVHRREQDDPVTGQRGGAARAARRPRPRAADLHHQHLGRVLARRRLARAHRRDGGTRRRAAARRALVSLRGHPAHAGRASRRRPPIPTRAGAGATPSTWSTTPRSCAPRSSTSTAG